MRVILTPVGSSGDVFPFIALGRALKQRGLDVHVTTAEPFRAAVLEAGLEFWPVCSEEVFQQAAMAADVWHPTKGLKIIFGFLGELLTDAYTCLEAVVAPGETVVVGHSLSLSTRIFEDLTGIPAVTTHLSPSCFRTEYIPPVFSPGIHLGRLPRWTKRSFWWAIDRWMLDPSIRPAVNALRQTVGLAPVSRVFHHWLHSPQQILGLFPEWFGEPQPDWPAELQMSGFVFHDGRDGTPANPALEAFLSNGSPPIAFTPGSANRHGRAFFEVGAAALKRLGRRGVFLSGFADQKPAALSDDVLWVPYAPFSTLFPRCAAVVHHGGVGTSAQGLAAGVPQLIMPLAFDQPDNADRLKRLGVGAWITPKRFTGQRVAEALRFLTTSRDVGSGCRRLQQRIDPELALARACDIIEAVATRPSQSAKARS